MFYIKKMHTSVLVVLISVVVAGWYGYADAKPNSHARDNAPTMKSRIKKLENTKLRVAFDASHGEIFSPANTGPLHYSDFNKEFEEAGAATFITTAPITLSMLSQYNTYIIAGPTQEFTGPEIHAFHRYVNNGGNLLVLLHISSPVARLTESFDILVSNAVISEGKNQIKGKSQDFYVTHLTKHPATKGIKRIAVYGTWGLLAQADATSLASTSKEAWADGDRNREFDEGEQKGRYTLIAANKKGHGNILVVADDAPFANLFYNTAENRTLGKNIVEWFLHSNK